MIEALRLGSTVPYGFGKGVTLFGGFFGGVLMGHGADLRAVLGFVCVRG